MKTEIYFDPDYVSEDLVIEQVTIGHFLDLEAEKAKECNPNCNPSCEPQCNPRCSPNCSPCFPYGKCNPKLFK